MSNTVSQVKTCRSCSTTFTATMSKLLGSFPVPVQVFRDRQDDCPDCKAAAMAAFEATSLRRRLNFTEEQVKAHFTANPPAQGDTLILAMGQFHRNTYRLVRVVNPASGAQKRIIVDKGDSFGGASYYRSGKSTFHPKGQTVLRPFIPAIGAKLSYESDTELSDADLQALLDA
ncbi:hypothetical protein [Pseudomonas aeruginosa]|uniref:hypothetical protein n=1 Tax=Pseudomonas aeruginosa TaxID=287 RepID=UPI001ADCC6A2|nr:hypothetical protein [Pseudomonas aeruginosa]MBO8337087.1 hypothetical protein [Pseudomonas aeruginosa]HCF4080868.1 hypothetical protein [Pseudomonas aeruginosa]